MYKGLLLIMIIIYLYPIIGEATIDLKILNEKSKNYQTFCRAEPIGGKLIITAAHCVEGFNLKEISIDKQNIIKIKKHPYYGKKRIINQLDFAIIEVKENHRKVNIKDPVVGMQIKVLDYIGVITDIYETEFKVSFPGSSVCLNDSGGGAFSKRSLIGILSRGSENCKKFAYMTKASIIKEYSDKKLMLESMALRFKKDFYLRLIRFNLGRFNDTKNRSRQGL